jgi:hypothetical protein
MANREIISRVESRWQAQLRPEIEALRSKMES